MNPRDELLAAALAHVTEHGIGDLSLRALATALGTSHRMLIYHFGSRDGLLVELVRAVEQRERDRLRAMTADPQLSHAERAERFWTHLTDPALWPSERLFFELYGQALQGRPHALPLLDGVVTDWLDVIVEPAVAAGVPVERARADARLDLAVTRGLLLDLLATGDVDGVRAAAQRHLDRHPGWHPDRVSGDAAGR
jgi:AcrR family transcriptional regulator